MHVAIPSNKCAGEGVASAINDGIVNEINEQGKLPNISTLLTTDSDPSHRKD